VKRTFDVVVSLFALTILAPVLGAIALGVLATSPGGVLFRQVRMGRGNRPFSIVKFRTMSVAQDAAKGRFDPGRDSDRITPIGRWLRKTKLDELPQFWNVLRGEMSLVGPRPEVPRWTEVYPERWEVVLSVRPGITDPASIEYRHEEDLLAAAEDPERTYREAILPRKLEIAERYVRTRTFAGDLAVLLRTATSIFQRDAGPATLGDSTAFR
jgi:lipopolysaccharide/colanic/teichoic acid biosynthesis glycosyltransferase